MWDTLYNLRIDLNSVRFGRRCNIGSMSSLLTNQMSIPFNELPWVRQNFSLISKFKLNIKKTNIFVAAMWNWWAFSAKDKIKNLQLHIFCYNQVEDNKVFVLKVHYNAFTQDADRVWVESYTTIRVRKEFFPYFFCLTLSRISHSLIKFI